MIKIDEDREKRDEKRYLFKNRVILRRF